MERKDMTSFENENTSEDRNLDAITGEPGAHPMGTGVGTAVGGALAGFAGGAVAGPVGATVGAVMGAVLGAYAGKRVAEQLDPSFELTHWRREYPNRTYFHAAIPFEDISPAYQYGWEARLSGMYERIEEALVDAEARWKLNGNQKILWSEVEPAFRDAWEHIGESLDFHR